MLVSLRKNLKAFVIKILMVILALTFVLWGIGDVLKSRQSAAIKIGRSSYSPAEIGPLFNEQVKMLENQLNYKFTNEDFESPEFRAIVLNQVINRLLMDKLADSMTIKVSDDMVKYQIASIPFFYKDGKFSKETLDQFLANNHITEKQFVTNLREEMKLQAINSTFALLDYTPTPIKNAIDRSLNQNRSVTVYTVDSKNIPAAPTPTEDDLRTLYNERLNMFEIPETRNINYALVSSDSISEKPEISEAMIQEEYEKRKRFMFEPEKRKVLQLIFKSEHEAKDALFKLSSGKTFKQLADEMNITAKDLSLGEITKDSLSPDITSKIFAKNKDEYTETISSPFGFHIFYIEDVIPQKAKDYAEVKDELKKDLYNEKLFESLSAMVQKLESDISLQTKYEELVQKYGLKTLSLKNVKKNANEQDAVKKQIIDSAFSNTTDSPNLISSSSSEFYLISTSVNSPASQVSFDKAKSDLLKMWYVKEDARNLQIKAQKVHEALKEGQDSSKILAEFKLDKPISVTVSSTEKAGLNSDMLEEIYTLKAVNDITGPIPTEAGFKIAKLNQVIPANLATQETLAKYRIPIHSELSLSLLSRLRKQYEVDINPEILK